MAQLGTAFDSSQHDDMNSGFTPFPAGDYPSKVVETGVHNTAKKNGKYIKIKFEILQGEFKGRFVWTNLNIVNPSTVAVEIAQKELATLCRAVGKAVIQDTQELHGIPFLMKVKIKPAKGDYPAGNEPCGYFPLNQAGQGEVGADGFPEEPAEQKQTGDTQEIADGGEVPWPED